MIPKIIHYCWFGSSPLPELALRCIASWRKFFPDYEIWEWREEDGNVNHNLNPNPNPNPNSNSNSNLNFNLNLNPNGDGLFDRRMVFDVNSIPYTAEAYRQKKYAFVSDYARFWILYQYGGIYFDTDVEVIRLMDDIIARGAFIGFELDPDGENSPLKYAPRYAYAINPGVGFGMEKEHPFLKVMMDKYAGMVFEIPTLPWGKTVVAHTTDELCKLGLQEFKGIQEGAGITIYPSEYFAPISVITGRLHVTENTRSIHRYMGSWDAGGQIKWRSLLMRYLPEWVLICYNRYKRKKYRISVLSRDAALCKPSQNG